MLRSTNNKGFQLTFSNGITISVQWGSHNYCCRRNNSADIFAEKETPIVESLDAEIAIWDSQGVWHNFGSDEVKGWVTTDEVGEWIDRVRRVSTLEELQDK
jgi:hypothetical protein